MIARVRIGGVRIFDDLEALARGAAERVTECARQAVEERGRFAAALSGGMTPRGLFLLLASEPYRGRIDWDRTHLFWSDERCVPPTDGASNYRAASQLLLSLVPLPARQVHRIRGEAGPSAAAEEYDRELRRSFGAGSATFDLVILGMGADGHTASLFPGAPALRETERLAVGVPASGSRHARVTLTLPAINGARTVLFLVAGAEKAVAVREVLENGDRQGLPAGRVRPVSGDLLWYLDRDAARMLDAIP